MAQVGDSETATPNDAGLALARPSWRDIWERYRAVLLTIASLIVGLVLWHLVSTFLVNPFLIPPPLVVFRTAVAMLISGEILADVSISMQRVLIGFVSGSLVAVIFGVLLGRIRLPGNPVHYSRNALTPGLPPPTLGEHTGELREALLGRARDDDR